MAKNYCYSDSSDDDDELSDIVSPVEAVCSKFGIDIRRNRKHKVLWNIVRTKHVEINDDLCDWMGMSEETRENGIRQFLDETVHIENEDGVPNGTRYCELNFIDFEKFLVQINAMNRINMDKITEFRELLSMCKNARIKCLENENERLRSDRQRSVSTLRNEIAPLVTPPLTNESKKHKFGLFKIRERVFYIMRRQEKSWDQNVETKRKLYPNLTPVLIWPDVSHAIDYGNIVKNELVGLEWIKKGGYNELELIKDTITEQMLIEKVAEIVARENDADQLAKSLEAESHRVRSE